MDWIKRGRNKTKRAYAVPSDLWDDAERYFAWCVDNPILEEKLVPRRNARPYREVIKRPRAFTAAGLCVFLGINQAQWQEWLRDDEGRMYETAHRIKAVMYEQKFTHAAVDMMNASIISRDLGLAEKTEISGAGGGAIETINSDMTPEEAADWYARTRDGR
jgi:hypothetical protein